MFIGNIVSTEQQSGLSYCFYSNSCVDISVDESIFVDELVSTNGF